MGLLTCNGICQQYKASNQGRSKYLSGQKRCRTCELFIAWNGDRCPCCRCMLRTKPRRMKYKEKLWQDTVT